MQESSQNRSYTQFTSLSIGKRGSLARQLSSWEWVSCLHLFMLLLHKSMQVLMIVKYVSMYPATIYTCFTQWTLKYEKDLLICSICRLIKICKEIYMTQGKFLTWWDWWSHKENIYIAQIVQLLIALFFSSLDHYMILLHIQKLSTCCCSVIVMSASKNTFDRFLFFTRYLKSWSIVGWMSDEVIAIPTPILI